MKKTISCLVLLSIFCLYSPAFSMLTLKYFRDLYPQYSDMSDFEVTSAYHKKHYSKMPFKEFAKRFDGPLEEKEKFTAAVNGKPFIFRLHSDKVMGAIIPYPEKYNVGKAVFESKGFKLSIRGTNKDVSILLNVTVHSDKSYRITRKEFDEIVLNDANFKKLEKMFNSISVKDELKLEIIKFLGKNAMLGETIVKIQHFKNTTYSHATFLSVVAKNRSYNLQITTPHFKTIDEAKKYAKDNKELIFIILENFRPISV